MTKLRNLFIFTGIIKAFFAYLDPGTGSLIIQLFIGAVVGLMVVFRSSFTSILYFFGLRKPSETDKDNIEDIDDENANNNDDQ